MFCRFLFVKNHKIAINSKNTEAIEQKLVFEIHIILDF